MVVDPVLPTYARTFSRLETSMAVTKDKTIKIVVTIAKRRSDISTFSGFTLFVIRVVREGLPSDWVRRCGLHVRQASILARHG